jgi:hypothetical protein
VQDLKFELLQSSYTAGLAQTLLGITDEVRHMRAWVRSVQDEGLLDATLDREEGEVEGGPVSATILLHHSLGRADTLNCSTTSSYFWEQQMAETTRLASATAIWPALVAVTGKSSDPAMARLAPAIGLAPGTTTGVAMLTAQRRSL